ncbi:glutamyl-tRNA reductase [Diaminobutyricibacter tongyongensis]|uniref:Glutamyl-tRNA reductase n=1 Tax=Leifsonia tongyongensis TaxID=1268043 RepID=A0A6L9XWX6_9MICO|nr:glutamyl-tRNA reductase [Diaminobutyricibacter tongyongensis]
MLLCFTSSHRTAGFDLLDRLERHAAAVTAALSENTELFSGTVVLATCNRFEAYLDVDVEAAGAESDAGSAAAETIIEAVSAASGVDARELRASSAVIVDEGVAEHLFAVSSGLESVVVGEGEIAGQVRRALDAARASGTVSSELERLFQVASRTSRGVKNRTGISSAGRSIVRLALDLAESRIADWSATRVLLVGTGAYAGASLAALRERGVTDIHVYSPSGRAQKFAVAHAAGAVPAGGLAETIAASGLIVTCSVAPDVILGVPELEAADAHPGALTRRLVIDLGLPRNVDPAVAHLDGVELLDLETISKHAPLEELNATDEARAIVGDAAAEFAARAAEQSVTPALVALRTHVFEVLDAEIARARSRGDSSEQTEAALRHLAGVLLHTPSVRARALARDGEADTFTEAANTLFGLDVDLTGDQTRSQGGLTALPSPGESAAS